MGKIIAKISLYDILAMIVPGSIVLMGLGMFDCISTIVQKQSFIQYIGQEGHGLWTTMGTILFLALAYTIGISIQTLNVWIWKFARKWNYNLVNHYIKDKIDDNRHELNDLVKPIKEIVDVNKRKDCAMNIYYKAYNTAIFFNPQTAVLILEKQIVMLRNMIIALLPMFVALFAPKYCCGIFCWIVFVGLLVLIIWARMKTAVTLVFEEYEAVRQLGLDKK